MNLADRKIDNSKSIEQKYIFIGQQKQMILDWLDHTCIRDPSYYEGTISSIYYDTPKMDLYLEKQNSDYLKSKARLRWYGNIRADDPEEQIRCYLEVKKKIGASRNKNRAEMTISSTKLTKDPFSEDDILKLPSKVYELNYFPHGILVPMLIIKYYRYRFVDVQSNSRISVDTNIRCTSANSKYLPFPTPVYLGMGVLEIKGKQRRLPSSCTKIKKYLNKEAFSKYAQCYERLMLPLLRTI